MSISSLVLRTRPDRQAEVLERISTLPGVEVHAAAENGQVVVTVDQPDHKEASDTLVELQNTEGVLNASLVFNYFEEEDDDPGEGKTMNAAGKEEAHDVIQA